MRGRNIDSAVVVLYTRHGCHLCEEAERIIRIVAGRVSFHFTVIDIDRDADLETRYGTRVPVVAIDGIDYLEYRVTADDLLQKLTRGHSPQKGWMWRLPWPARTEPMSELAKEECIPCKGDVPRLGEEESEALLTQLGRGWMLSESRHLEKKFRFGNFVQALAFTNQVGSLAESQGHHPEITLGWGHADIEIWTHAVSGLTRSDFVLAAKIEKLEESPAG